MLNVPENLIQSNRRNVEYGVFSERYSEKEGDRAINMSGMSVEIGQVGTKLADAFEIFNETGITKGVSTFSNGLFGAYFTYQGIKDIKKAIIEKDPFGILGGLSNFAIATQSALGVSDYLVNMENITAIAGPIVSAALRSPMVHTLYLGTGIFHGCAETIVGGRQVYNGIITKDKTKIIDGITQAGMGISVAAMTMGAGTLGGIALAGFIGVKIITHKDQIFDRISKIINGIFS